ncbi:hypothetical protein [Flavobacterium sp.]|uniref:hypothetical protein n=1 Tax=Flavobacterium sp. TaxID=239 RepID=UPI002FDCC5F3
MAKTFDDYILAVRSKYEFEKSKVYSDFLLQPSPAQLRDLCLIIHDRGLSKKDKEVFELFFKTKPDIELRKAIENIDVEKLKKICNFLNKKSQTTSQNTLNLIAILVDYDLRPFSYFLNSNQKQEDIEIESLPEYNNAVHEIQAQIPEQKKNFKRKFLFGFLGLTGLTSICYTAKDIISPDPQCMQWRKNHYEIVDCNSESQQGLLKQYDIIPFDDHQSKLIKIEVSDTTIFFKNGKSLYWYCKVDGKPEFFNTHGIHPETGKALKPVSEYIVEKYVR